MLKYDDEINNYIHALNKEGINIHVEGGKIKYKCEKGALPPEHLETIKENKPGIIGFFEKIMNDTVPLTSIQYAYLLGKEKSCELGGISSHYYIEYEMKNIDIDKLEAGVNELIKESDALRMVVKKEGHMVFFQNCSKYHVERYKTDSLNGHDDVTSRMKVREAWQHKDYEIGSWPMFHFAVGKDESEVGNDVLHISFDCMILDAWSAKLMVEKLFRIYEGKEITFPELTFKGYMKEMCDYPEDEKALGYWEEQTKTMPLFPKLQTKKKFGEISEMIFDRVEHSFSKEETKRLYEKCKKIAVTPASVICTLFMKTLSDYSKNKDIAVNVTLFNRKTKKEWGNKVNEILGEFTNNAVIRYEEKNEKLEDSMKAIQKQFWNLLRYRDFEGTKILGMIADGAVGKAVMPVVYTCMLGGEVTGESFGFTETYSLSQTPQVMIDHHVRDDLGFLKISWDYVRDLFEKKYINYVFERYVENIRSFI